VVGVLVEVPVMLSLVALANRTERHFARDVERVGAQIEAQGSSPS
jgi:ACR3 family arsenite efflux pump ArsB